MDSKIFICLGMVLFAIFGACVKWLNIKKQYPTTFMILMVEATTAAFVGFLVYSLYMWLDLPVGLAFMVTGLAGYSGPKAIELLLRWFIRHFKLEDLMDQVSASDSVITMNSGIQPQQSAISSSNVQDKGTEEITEVP